jgi:membrane protease YdiL (CAAX protease family)
VAGIGPTDTTHLTSSQLPPWRGSFLFGERIIWAEKYRRKQMKIKLFVQSNSIIVYFILAYIITWGGILLAMAGNGFKEEIGIGTFALTFVAMFVGPSLTGLTLTAILEGKEGVRELSSRMKRWRVGFEWIAVAVLTIPVLMSATLYFLSATVSPTFRPGWMIPGFVVGLIAGFFEEIGWTGFALPRLQKRYGGLVAGILLGLLWAFWHMLADYFGNIHTMKEAWFPHFLVYWAVSLTAYRFLMTWVYQNTGSLFVAQLMHAFYTGTQVVLTPANASFAEGLLWKSILADCLVIFAAGVAVVFGRNLISQPVQEGLATNQM